MVIHKLYGTTLNIKNRNRQTIIQYMKWSLVIYSIVDIVKWFDVPK